MIYLILLFTFFKIGLFSFGGGYAMIPMIEREITSHGWLTAAEFIDILAIAEMTPGPISINSATFIGFKTGGVIGSIFATLGVALPSLIIILLISRFFFKYFNHPIKDSIFYGVRPVIAGLIFSASIFVAKTSLLKQEVYGEFSWDMLAQPMKIINLGSIFVFLLSLFFLIKFKLHPIVIILISGFIGIILYYVLPLSGLVII